ncbi:BamA/TamA family outer membrane protein [Mucilaginibacter sp.]
MLVISIRGFAYGQVGAVPDTVKVDTAAHIKGIRKQNVANTINKQYDVGDLTRNILHPHIKNDTLKKSSGIIVIPNIAANPTIGEQIGIKAVVGRRLGGDPNTFLSVGATSASITSKGIIYFYVNHNIFTPGNKWNFQGNIVAAKTVTPDCGLGIGRDITGGSVTDNILADPEHKVYSVHSMYYDIREKVYKEVAKDLFFGAGLDFAIRHNITNKDTVNNATPSSVYNNQHGFPQDHYSSDGFLFDAEYISRDNPNRAYKGIYADLGLRINQTWIGSTKNEVQLNSDFRKYFSLSDSNPEEVLAFWNWGSYLISGNIPYLELPGTARDMTFRSGRGYTTQYFKGTQFNDTEAEFRFPILANKFISGVTFVSAQSANDEHGTKLFQVFQPGYGAGLRVLFNKATRTNLALDYAFGRFGNRGFFLNLNEAF